MKLKNRIKSLINKMPYVRGLYQQSINCCFPNGHFYSPVISIEDVKSRQAEIWKSREIDGVLGIDLNKNLSNRGSDEFTAVADGTGILITEQYQANRVGRDTGRKLHDSSAGACVYAKV